MPQPSKKNNFSTASQHYKYTEQERQNLDLTASVKVPQIKPNPTKRRLEKCSRCGRGRMLKNLWEGVAYCQICGFKKDPADLRQAIFRTLSDRK